MKRKTAGPKVTGLSNSDLLALRFSCNENGQRAISWLYSEGRKFFQLLRALPPTEHELPCVVVVKPMQDMSRGSAILMLFLHRVVDGLMGLEFLGTDETSAPLTAQ